MINNEQNNPFPFTAAYFSSLTIGNVKCFKENQTLNLTANNGKPARWTVILGNNNTGKTTLLKCLAALEPKEASLIIGEEDSTLQELQNGKKKSMTVKASWPSYLLPNFLFRDFNGLNSSTLRCDFLLSKAESNQLSSKDFTSFNQFANTNWGGAFEGGKGASMEGGDARFSNFIPLFSYGASRIMSRKALSETINRHPHGSLFENRFIPNVEDWLLGLFLAAKLGKEKADSDLNFATEILKSGILPDVKDLELDSIEKENGFENFVHFLTDYGWVRLQDLGFGYQTMIAWVLDLTRRMIERYPKAKNPLEQPAVVLVDEIDLHLHPDWQRKIISYLTKYFPNIQFIVTAHSPLIVQSADEVNLVLLKKTENRVQIEQPGLRTYKGWTIEEILTTLMDLEGATMSQTYLDLMEQFDTALDSDNLELAKKAFSSLDKILHEENPQRKIMQIQMTALSRLETV